MWFGEYLDDAFLGQLVEPLAVLFFFKRIGIDYVAENLGGKAWYALEVYAFTLGDGIAYLEGYSKS
ncbi:hypothetical protein MASR2M48_21780 [Spirochaetota bacterium]